MFSRVTILLPPVLRTSEDYVFINLVDHGNFGIFGFPNDVVRENPYLYPEFSLYIIMHVFHGTALEASLDFA